MFEKITEVYEGPPSAEVISRKLKNNLGHSLWNAVLLAGLASVAAWALAWRHEEPAPVWFWYFIVCSGALIVGAAMAGIALINFRQGSLGIKFPAIMSFLVLSASFAAAGAGFIVYVVYPFTISTGPFFYVALLIFLPAVLGGPIVYIVDARHFARYLDRCLKQGFAGKVDEEQIDDREMPDVSALVHGPLKTGRDSTRIIIALLGMAIFGLAFFTGAYYLFAALFLAFVLAVTFLPKIYQRRATPFEQSREVRASINGTGARLLVYDDGIELREYLSSIFIPYEWLDDLPEKMSFSSTAVPLRSKLSHVPEGLDFHCNDIKSAIKLIREKRDEYMEPTKKAELEGETKA